MWISKRQEKIISENCLRASYIFLKKEKEQEAKELHELGEMMAKNFQNYQLSPRQLQLVIVVATVVYEICLKIEQEYRSRPEGSVPNSYLEKIIKKKEDMMRLLNKLHDVISDDQELIQMKELLQDEQTRLSAANTRK